MRAGRCMGAALEGGGEKQLRLLRTRTPYGLHQVRDGNHHLHSMIEAQTAHTASVFSFGEPEAVARNTISPNPKTANACGGCLLRITMITTALHVPSRVKIIKCRPFSASMDLPSSREAPGSPCSSPNPRIFAKEAG